MMESQKLAIRASEIRVKLTGLAGAADALTDEQRAEVGTLRNEMVDVETRMQAAVTSEDAVEILGAGDSSEDRAYIALVGKANLGEIFGAAVEKRQTDGAELELQQHHKLGSNQIPFDLFRSFDPSEHRAAGTTPAPGTTGSTEAAVIPAVFASPVAEFLGIDMPTVMAGDAVFPVITTRPTVGGPHKDSTVVDNTAGAFDADLLAPSRIQAAVTYRRTDGARFRGMAESLRENLSMALGDALDKEILSGANGLLNGTNLANHNVSAVTTFANYLSQFGYGRVDGRFAGSVSDIKVVMGSGTYGHAGSVYRNTSVDRTALNRLDEVTGGVTVSAHVPAVASKKQNAVIRLGMRRDAISPIWDGITLIPDEITGASKGEITVTAVLLHAVKILRVAGFYKQQSQHP